jgi:3-dehydroshikimate dehydratase
MIFPGLVSVTFRNLSPQEIVRLASQAGLTGIEWGGDIHVPHGDLDQAQRVRDLTENAGLRVAAYGSYYRVWPQEPVPFDSVLKTALAVGAPAIRVWAGKIGSMQAPAEHRAAVITEAARISQMAADYGITVAFEFHVNTLTDSDSSALDLLNRCNHPNLRCYWQPRIQATFNDNIASLVAISPWLSNLHVFHWQPAPTQEDRPQVVRQPLAEGKEDWQMYLAHAMTLPGDRYAMLEFVRDDDPQAFLVDAGVLKALCSTKFEV